MAKSKLVDDTKSVDTDTNLDINYAFLLKSIIKFNRS